MSDRYPEAISAFMALVQAQCNDKGEYCAPWAETTREERYEKLQEEILEYYQARYDYYERSGSAEDLRSEAAQLALCLVMEMYCEGLL